MTQTPKKLKGRPSLQTGQRNRKIDVRFTEEEFKNIIALEQELDIKRTDLIRIRVLQGSHNLAVNARKLIEYLDDLGNRIEKTGSSINQLGNYSVLLTKQSILSSKITERQNELLDEYNKSLQAVEIVLRKIIRQMGR